MNCGVHCEMQTFVNNWMSECVPACGIGLGQGCFMVRMHASAAYMFNFAAVLVWWQMTCLSNTWHAELHCFFFFCKLCNTTGPVLANCIVTLSTC